MGKEEQKSIVDNKDQEGYHDLISSIKDILNKKPGSKKDDDLGNEPENQRTFQRFLGNDGKQLQLEGVDDKDSMFFRIEALKVYLEKLLGDDKFCKAYKYLIDPPTDDENNAELYKFMGNNKSKYIPLIYQLIVCEDN